MIRFMPDTWFEAVMRPIAMAAPNGAVYVEYMAPDWRFLFILLLFVPWFVWRKKDQIAKPSTALLLSFTAVCFAVWLWTSGNGRYFMPILLVAGPLCIGMVSQLPIRNERKVFLALILVGLQCNAVYEADPFWHQAVGAWHEEPFFVIEQHPQMNETEVTYITFTGLSYSMIAPKFHPTSRWINVSSQINVNGNGDERRRVKKIIAQSKHVKLVIPSISGFLEDSGGPTTVIKDEVNNILSQYQMRLSATADCEFVTSSGYARRELGSLEGVDPKLLKRFGFSFCEVDYPVQSSVKKMVLNPKSERVYQRLEAQCPRLFAPGVSSGISDGGHVRFYPDSEMRVYVFDSGLVYYKYWRVMNPVLIGQSDEILNEKFRMDCNNIRGRSGLPWDRQL